MGNVWMYGWVLCLDGTLSELDSSLSAACARRDGYWVGKYPLHVAPGSRLPVLPTISLPLLPLFISPF